MNNPLSILSATTSDNVEGFIYIEAYKELHVREAIGGLSNILSGKIQMVPLEEMPQVYQIDKAITNEIQKHQLVRIKNGLYIGDLALVEQIDDQKVWLRLVPRVEPPVKEKPEDKKANNVKADKFKSRFIRQTQRFFNPKLFPNVNKTQVKDLGSRHFYVYKNQFFRKGFLYKAFPTKQIETQNVKPTVEEAQKFASGLSKNDGNDSSEDETKPEELIKKLFLDGGSVDIAKGDKIRIVKGDFTGITGSVVSLEEKQVLFKPNLEGFNDIIKYDVANVVKFFEPGDDVRVIEGKYKGETGLVTKIDGGSAYISLD